MMLPDPTDDLERRLNWQQACAVLGCKKSQFYALVRAGKLPAHGIGKRYRWYLQSDCENLLEERRRSGN